MAAADAPAYFRKRRRESSRCASPTSIGRSSLRLRRPPPEALADIDLRPPQDGGGSRPGIPRNSGIARGSFDGTLSSGRSIPHLVALTTQVISECCGENFRL